MGVLDRIRAWWRRRAWSRSDAGPGGVGAADYVCTVCGTAVDGPEGPCPLCRGSDVVSAGADEAAAGPDADGTPTGTTPDERRVADDDGAPVERLRRLRADGELLERYADHWRPVDGGFRVETGDGTREVDSREEVVALLRAEDGSRPPRS
jgi:hypothetical protein